MVRNYRIFLSHTLLETTLIVIFIQARKIYSLMLCSTESIKGNIDVPVDTNRLNCAYIIIRGTELKIFFPFLEFPIVCQFQLVQF